MTKGQTSSRLKYGKQSIQAIIIQPLVCFISCYFARNGIPYDNPYAERVRVSRADQTMVYVLVDGKPVTRAFVVHLLAVAKGLEKGGNPLKY